MSLRTRTMSIASALALTAVAAVAQAAPQAPEELPACPPGEEMAPPTPPPAPPPQQTYYEEPPPAPVAPAPRRRNRIFAPGSVSFVTGAGPADYFGNSLTSTGASGAIDLGAAWDARFTFGTSSIIALEAGYIGSNNQINVVGDNGHINSNGLDGTLRLQLPFRAQPYIFAGVGWNHMTIDNGDANPQITRTFRQTDDQVVIPAGAGFTGYVTRHATVDLRGTYRLIPNQDIVIQSDRALHQWMAQARVGYTF